MHLLIDMNLTLRWVDYLRGGGHEATHWSTVGACNATDPEICEYARTHGLIVMTNDLDFPHILALTRFAAPSVILLRNEPLVPEIRGLAVLAALSVCAEELKRGAIVSLDLSDLPRVRVLPL